VVLVSVLFPFTPYQPFLKGAKPIVEKLERRILTSQQQRDHPSQTRAGILAASLPQLLKSSFYCNSHQASLKKM